MSDEPTTVATADDTPQKQYGIAWGDEIDETRKQELWARLRAWWDEADHGERVGPFAGEKLTGAEVFWLAVCALADSEGTATQIAEIHLRMAQNDAIDSTSLSLPTLCLTRADLSRAQMNGATLRVVQFDNANLMEVEMKGADLFAARLEDANLHQARLGGTNLFGADLTHAYLFQAYLEDAILNFAQLEEAFLEEAVLTRANLTRARMNNANLAGAQLQTANLDNSSMRRVDFSGAHLEGANLSNADLRGADLRHASLDKQTVLSKTLLEDVRLDGVIFDDTNLSDIDWSQVPKLQDERIAQTRDEQVNRAWGVDEQTSKVRRKSHATRKDEYKAAARAYRRLAVALQTSGMSDESMIYAYRAQLMQRAIYRFSGWRTLGKWLFSWFLCLIAGYGYRLGWSAIVYLASVALFAVGYFALGVTVGPHLSPYEAAVVSLTAFHGRGFFATAFKPGDPQAGLAALEAVFGLLIEISFIATFTQRFFGAK